MRKHIYRIFSLGHMKHTSHRVWIDSFPFFSSLHPYKMWQGLHAKSYAFQTVKCRAAVWFSTLTQGYQKKKKKILHKKHTALHILVFITKSARRGESSKRFTKVFQLSSPFWTCSTVRFKWHQTTSFLQSKTQSKHWGFISREMKARKCICTNLLKQMKLLNIRQLYLEAANDHSHLWRFRGWNIRKMVALLLMSGPDISRDEDATPKNKKTIKRQVQGRDCCIWALTSAGSNKKQWLVFQRNAT